MAMRLNELAKDFPLLGKNNLAQINTLKKSLLLQNEEITQLQQRLDSGQLDTILQKITFRANDANSLLVDELAALISKVMLIHEKLHQCTEIGPILTVIEELDAMIRQITQNFKKIGNEKAITLLPKVIEFQSNKAVKYLEPSIRKLILSNKRALDPLSDWSEYLDLAVLVEIPKLYGIIAVVELFGWMPVQYELPDIQQSILQKIDAITTELKKLPVFKLLSESALYYIVKDPEFSSVDTLDFAFKYITGVQSIIMKQYIKQIPTAAQNSAILGDAVTRVCTVLLSSVVRQKQTQIIGMEGVSKETKGNILFTFSKHLTSFLYAHSPEGLLTWHRELLSLSEGHSYLVCYLLQTLESLSTRAVSYLSNQGTQLKHGQLLSTTTQRLLQDRQRLGIG